jgi:hypothetical protein
MKIDTADKLTDTGPLYQALAELTSNDYPIQPFARRFIYEKMRHDLKALKETVAFVSERLDAYEVREPPKRGRKGASE